MANPNYTEAFRAFGAKLTNRMWSVSAFGDGGCLVIAMWSHLFSPGETGTMVYREDVSKWENNISGRNELTQHLNMAIERDAPVRAVIVTPLTKEDAAMLGKVTDESKINKTFNPKKDALGKVESFDNGKVVIVFRR